MTFLFIYICHVLICLISPLDLNFDKSERALDVTFPNSAGGTLGPIHTGQGRDACTNWNIFPLMLLASSVDTPTHINRSHLFASRCMLHPASCVDWAFGPATPSTARFASQLHCMCNSLLHHVFSIVVATPRVVNWRIALRTPHSLFWETQKQSRTRTWFWCGKAIIVGNLTFLLRGFVLSANETISYHRDLAMQHSWDLHDSGLWFRPL